MRDKYLFVPDPGTPLTHQPDRDELARLFGINKTTRKARSNYAEQDVRARLGLNPPNAHADLHHYEKDILQGGGNWQRLKATLLLRYGNKLQIVENPGGLADFYITRDGNTHRVGTAYQGESRFVRLPVQPASAGGTPVYKRRGDASGRHYIQLTTSNTFVRRFVTRGLNYTDGMNLSNGFDLTSVIDPNTAPLATNRPLAQVVDAQGNERGLSKHGVVANANLTESQQIISHTRGWTKRYISTGVSNRPAFSTRGTEFQSIYGAVVIDLALVPSGQIFDIHRHDLAANHLGRPATDVLTYGDHTNTNDLAEQQYLALRDVIRTRELLIKGTVPYAAVCKQNGARCLVGIGSPGAANASHSRSAAKVAALPPLVLARRRTEENLGFKDWHSGLRWHLVEFADAGAAIIAYSHIMYAREQGQSVVIFNKFAPDRPVGMV